MLLQVDEHGETLSLGQSSQMSPIIMGPGYQPIAPYTESHLKESAMQSTRRFRSDVVFYSPVNSYAQIVAKYGLSAQDKIHWFAQTTFFVKDIVTEPSLDKFTADTLSERFSKARLIPEDAEVSHGGYRIAMAVRKAGIRHSENMYAIQQLRENKVDDLDAIIQATRTFMSQQSTFTSRTASLLCRTYGRV